MMNESASRVPESRPHVAVKTCNIIKVGLAVNEKGDPVGQY